MHRRDGWTIDARRHIRAILSGAPDDELRLLDALAREAGSRARLDDALDDTRRGDDYDIRDLAQLTLDLAADRATVVRAHADAPVGVTGAVDARGGATPAVA